MSRTTKMISHIKEALKHQELYTDEEIRVLKQQLSQLQESHKELLLERKNGFGFKI